MWRRAVPERVAEYTYFTHPRMRSDIFKFCKGLTEYLEKNGVRNILFIDRSARPAWVGVDEYWRQNVKGAAKPKFLFINPDGFNPTLVDTPALQKDAEMRDIIKSFDVPLLGAQGHDIKTDIVRSIVGNLKRIFPALVQEKDAPLVLFDTCSHTGGTINVILTVLREAGFKDIRVITANSPDPDSGIIPVTKLDRYTHLTSCYPFGHDDLVRKTTGIVSAPAARRQNLKGPLIRKEMRTIIRGKGK